MRTATNVEAKERRRHERHPMFVKAEINGEPVTVLDASVGGIGGTVELRGELRNLPSPGEAATVVLNAENGESVVLTVEVKRVDPDLHLFGAQIVEMSDEQFAFMNRLCADRSD